MNGKIIILVFAALLGSLLGEAQQLPHYSQYVLNDFVMNPAIAGKNPYFEGKSNNRYQWIGITDAPRTYVLSVNGPIQKENMGVGAYLFTDITGPTRRVGFSGTYAYHLKLNEEMKLSLGLSAGILQYAVDGSKITLHDEGDMALSSGYQSDVTADFGFGAYFYTEKYYFGAAAPQIYPATLKFFDYKSQSKIVTHFYLIGGYKFDINSEFQVEPTMAVKYVKPAPIQADIGARVHYQKKAWLGVAYRTMDAVSALIGYTYKENMTIGYSYDFTTSNLRNYSSGTHEIFLAVKFYKVKDQAE